MALTVSVDQLFRSYLATREIRYTRCLSHSGTGGAVQIPDTHGVCLVVDLEAYGPLLHQTRLQIRS